MTMAEVRTKQHEPELEPELEPNEGQLVAAEQLVAKDVLTGPMGFEGGDDMTMAEVRTKEHEAELEPELEREEGQLVAAEQFVAKDVLTGPTSPMTRSKTKLFNQAISGMLRHLSHNEEKVIQTTMVLITAQDDW
ncbi:unnamed protein product [Microthlaspi erraticum]|uniref:Uncharacterized protein n=1 Tax=Microthlaspi erraticum TaxID=1685480 RepID=A0A6D2HZI7_9BRAS|nr:unnamed protein product [Microthlaspi erraticum]